MRRRDLALVLGAHTGRLHLVVAPLEVDDVNKHPHSALGARDLRELPEPPCVGLLRNGGVRCGVVGIVASVVLWLPAQGLNMIADEPLGYTPISRVARPTSVPRIIRMHRDARTLTS